VDAFSGYVKPTASVRMLNSAVYAIVFLNICSFGVPFKAAQAENIPQLLKPVDSNGQLQESGALIANSSNAQPCSYLDRVNPTIGHVNGLTTRSLQSVSGNCFDVSFVLPENTRYVSHSVSIYTNDATPSECKPIDPVIGGNACIPRTKYVNGRIKWNPGVILAGKDCSEFYEACSNFSFFELLVPLTSCQNIGVDFRTMKAYFLLPASGDNYNYRIAINVQPCAGGGGFESNQ
jgi:hypothetical protein